MSNTQKTKKSPQGKMVEIDGILYMFIDGKLYRYANLTLDKGFKITLGRPGSEEVLKHMLNRLLGLRIKWLEYRNTEHPGMTEDDRSSRFDVYCEDEDGNGFQVEMQNWSQKHFHKRAVYYSSLVLQDQAARARREQKQRTGNKKNWDYNYKPLYVVSFLNFRNWISEKEVTRINQYISIYRYTDIETKEELGDGTNLIFIDLHSFCKRPHQCTNMQDWWMYSLKNMFNLTECPSQVLGTEVEDLFTQSELARMTLEQRLKIEESIMTENDIRNSIAEQLEEGRARALAEGKAEGRAEGRAEGLEIGRVEGREEGLEIGREEGREEGLEIGRVEGREEGLEIGREEGREIGREEGLEIGREEGREIGRAEGLETGRAEGELAKAREIATKLLEKGLSRAEIAAIVGIEESELFLL